MAGLAEWFDAPDGNKASRKTSLIVSYSKAPRMILESSALNRGRSTGTLLSASSSHQDCERRSVYLEITAQKMVNVDIEILRGCPRKKISLFEVY